MNKLQLIKPIVLCGGVGSRLWPLSKESFPKQFVPLVGGQSLLSLTVERVKKMGQPLFITNEEYRFFVLDVLKQSLQCGHIAAASILLEPVSKNTAAAMASAAFMPGVLPSDLLLFLPSDHFVPDVEKFTSTIESGIVAAEAGYIVTFGVQPSFPSTDYGYIQQGSNLNYLNSGTEFTYAVSNFIEKPPLECAKEMLLLGGYLWNAGIFLCKASVLIDALLKLAPDIYQSSRSAMQDAQIDGDFVRPNKELFLACRAESIDYAVMEHFDNVAVVRFSGAWSDLGSWSEVANLSRKDALGNRINGQGVALQSTNTYIYSPDRRVVALGTSDLVIVNTLDEILVASTDKLKHLKEVVIQLKNDSVSDTIANHRVFRPWGWFDMIDIGDCFQVKRIVVKPGASLSMQMHNHRAEHWIVVKGLARVTNGENIFLLEENQSTYIPIGVKHRLENPGKTFVEIIEVQSGSYLGEDDIVRFEDTYGRT